METTTVFFRAPIEITQPVEVLRVNNCKFSLGETDFTKGEAILAFAVKQNWPGEDTVEPNGN
jgi:hypothetical protein